MSLAWPLAPLSTVFLAAAVALLLVAAVTMRAGGDTRVTRWFLTLLIVDAVWAALSVVPLEAGTATVAFVGEVARVAGGGVAAITWFCFALVYTGRDDWLTHPRIAVVAAPLAVHVVGFATTPFHGLSARALTVTVREGTTAVAYDTGPLFAGGTAYALLVVAVGTGVVIETAVRDADLYADQSLALVVGSLMPIVATAAGLTDAVPTRTTNLTPATLMVTAGCYGYALFRTDLLTAGPTFAVDGRRLAVETLDEGFLIADGTGRVVDANPAARELLDTDRVVGRQLSALLPVDARSGRRTVETANGRVLEAEVVVGDREAAVGRVATLRDVTERRHRRERVEVLNRVLRHNLRNDLNVVRGFASQIAAHAHRREPEARGSEARGNGPHGDERVNAEGVRYDGATVGGGSGGRSRGAPRARGLDTAAAAERIVERADALLTVADHARTMEETLAATGSPSVEPVDLRDVVARALDTATAADDRDVGCEVVLPDEPIRSNEAIVSVVIEELVDNAVRHNDSREPTVWVGADVTDRVRITVADDGPGIPEQDRIAVESGSESALEHGSRLGLWMVRWGVQTLGGEMRIRERDWGGSAIDLFFPLDPDDE